MYNSRAKFVHHPEGEWLNIKISYQYRKSFCGDMTILRPSYLHNGIFYTVKTKSLTWISAMIFVYSQTPGGLLNIKMPSYQYRKSHCGDKTILRPSYLHNGISYTGKMTFLYWIRALLIFFIQGRSDWIIWTIEISSWFVAWPMMAWRHGKAFHITDPVGRSLVKVPHKEKKCEVYIFVVSWISCWTKNRTVGG